MNNIILTKFLSSVLFLFFNGSDSASLTGFFWHSTFTHQIYLFLAAFKGTPNCE